MLVRPRMYTEHAPFVKLVLQVFEKLGVALSALSAHQLAPLQYRARSHGNTQEPHA
jgi:hypothetical protein